MQIEYEINLKQNQIVNVKAKINLLDEELNNNKYIKITIPKWTDGSYQYLDHIKNVIKKSNNLLPTYNDNEFMLKINGKKELNFEYDIFANDNSVRSIFLSSERFYCAPQALFFYPQLLNKNFEEENNSEQFALYKINNCKYLNKKEGNSTLFFGSSFKPSKKISLKNIYKEYILVTNEENKINWEFTNKFGIKHNIIVTAFNFNKEKKENIEKHKDFFIKNLEKMTSFTMEKMGYSPFEEYNFYLHLEEGEYGGVEFDSSSITIVNYSWLDLFNNNEDLENKNIWKAMEVLTHEYFHAWNVRNIKPLEFKPINDNFPQYSFNKLPETSPLWIFEGLTSFMGKKLMADAGLISKEKLDNLIFEDYKMVYKNDGWKQPLIDSASNAYVQLYKRTPNSKHYFTHYYKKGCLLWALISEQMNDEKDQQNEKEDVFYKFINDVVFNIKKPLENMNSKEIKYINFNKVMNDVIKYLDEIGKPEIKYEFNYNNEIKHKIIPTNIEKMVLEYNKINKKMLSDLIEIDENGSVVSIDPQNNYDIYLKDKILSINKQNLMDENNKFNKEAFSKLELSDNYEIKVIRKNEEIDVINFKNEKLNIKNKIRNKI